MVVRFISTKEIVIHIELNDIKLTNDSYRTNLHRTDLY